ncbi:protein ALP1-like [Scomber scombrus]|uniref:Protein ALP1-like n=1 Tax=Scomber scombrus TaxID=13677 RepID=A0AAV1Q6V6_SCOSC
MVHTGVEKSAFLHQEIIRMPIPGALDKVGQAFAQLANSPVFLRCVGAINGCHVRIKTPLGPEGQKYVNRRLSPSIQLQAVCDRKSIFITTFVRYTSSIQNTRVMKNSRIYKEALYPHSGQIIDGTGIRADSDEPPSPYC